MLQRTILNLDFDVNARWQIEAHECINGLAVRIEHINQPLVRPDFEVFLLNPCQ